MTASLGVSCSLLWLVATISSNVKFLLNFITIFYQEFENLRIFPFVAPLLSEGSGEAPTPAC